MNHCHPVMAFYDWFGGLALAVRTNLRGSSSHRQRPEGRDHHHQYEKPGNPAMHVYPELLTIARLGLPHLANRILQGGRATNPAAQQFAERLGFEWFWNRVFPQAVKRALIRIVDSHGQRKRCWTQVAKACQAAVLPIGNLACDINMRNAPAHKVARWILCIDHKS